MLDTKLSGDERVPLYQRLADKIREAVLNGGLKPGERLPSEVELIERFGLSPGTVQKALQVLVLEKVLERFQGKGTFVCEVSFSELFSRLSRFKRKDGSFKILSSKFLKSQTEPIPEEIARELNVAAASKGISMLRLRLDEGETVAIEKIWLVFEKFKELMKLEVREIEFLYPLYYQICKKLVIQIEDTITAELPTPEISDLLEIDTNTPVLVVDRLTTGSGNEPLEWRRCWIRSDRLTYQADAR